MTASALYHGTVCHQRLRPVRHVLRYRIFMMLLDLDEAPNLARRVDLFGFDRPGVVSFWQTDHGDGSANGLRRWVDQHLADNGFATGGAIRVLSMPRVFGYCFNPITIYFCSAPNGNLQAMLYEVRNTFGQRHAYLLAADSDASPVAHGCAKMFHVSPFMDMDMHYRFRVSTPGARVALSILTDDDTGTMLAARFAGRRQDISNVNLAWAALRMPVLGLKVLFAIHWEAVKLWTKGIKLRPAPPPPASAITFTPIPVVQVPRR